MCSAPNVYMFVYILIGTHMVPLTRSTLDNFIWNTIELHNKDHAKVPLPREGQNVWEYDEKIWSFGGFVYYMYDKLKKDDFIGSPGRNN